MKRQILLEEMDDGKVDLAQYDDIGNTVLGILTEDLLYDEVGSIIIQGVITNPDWNWTTGTTPVPVGSELWVDNGNLVTEEVVLVLKGQEEL